MHGLIMKANQSPHSPQYYPLFQRLYEEAVPLGVKLINNYLDHLANGTELAEEFHFDFGAGPIWETLSLEA